MNDIIYICNYLKLSWTKTKVDLGSVGYAYYIRVSVGTFNNVWCLWSTWPNSSVFNRFLLDNFDVTFHA